MPERKVYLPKWYRWFVTPFLVVMWGLLTYDTFWKTQAEESPHTVVWLGITAVFVAIGVLIWLMTSGKLPAYVIEEE